VQALHGAGSQCSHQRQQWPRGGDARRTPDAACRCPEGRPSGSMMSSAGSSQPSGDQRGGICTGLFSLGHQRWRSRDKEIQKRAEAWASLRTRWPARADEGAGRRARQGKPFFRLSVMHYTGRQSRTRALESCVRSTIHIAPLSAYGLHMDMDRNACSPHSPENAPHTKQLRRVRCSAKRYMRAVRLLISRAL